MPHKGVQRLTSRTRGSLQRHRELTAPARAQYWIKYLSKQSSRGKVYRLVQNVLKLAAFQLKQAGAPAELAKWAKTGSKTFSNGRKFGRLGKFVDISYKGYAWLKKGPALGVGSEEQLFNTLTLAIYVSDVMFYVYDLMSWGNASKFWPFPAWNVKQNRLRWNALRYVLKAVQGVLGMRRTEPGSAKFNKFFRAAIRNALDANDPLSGLGYNSLNAGQTGTIGCITSVMGIYEDFAPK